MLSIKAMSREGAPLSMAVSKPKIGSRSIDALNRPESSQLAAPMIHHEFDDNNGG